MEFVKEFPDDAACLNYLWRTRYSRNGTHADCPECGERRRFKRYETSQQRQSWSCTHCGHHLHPTADTIFHKSSTALHLWFYAIYLITSTRCGISAKQLEREIGVGYKTAWRMFNLIRNSLMAETPAPLSGKVEMDETYFSKSRRLGLPIDSGQASDERTVFAMVERKGNVVARHVGGPTTLRVEPHIKEFVLPATTIFTDQSNIYQSLPKKGTGIGGSTTRSASTSRTRCIHRPSKASSRYSRAGFAASTIRCPPSGSSRIWTSTHGDTTTGNIPSVGPGNGGCLSARRSFGYCLRKQPLPHSDRKRLGYAPSSTQ
jgi:transposase-like protein